MNKRIEVELRLPRDIIAYYGEIASLSGEPIETCINVVLAMQIFAARRVIEGMKNAPKKKAARTRKPRG